LEPAKPRSIGVCVLLSKKKQRAREVTPDYVGFEIEDEFVVGYGLDFRERYRNLPYIGVLKKDLLEQPDK
jgi:hypoxanthine phosphoribosyltransferase